MKWLNSPLVLWHVHENTQVWDLPSPELDLASPGSPCRNALTVTCSSHAEDESWQREYISNQEDLCGACVHTNSLLIPVSMEISVVATSSSKLVAKMRR